MGFFKSITKVFKKVTKAVLPFAGAVLGNAILPGIGGTLIGGFLGGKAAGQSTTQAALGSLGSLVGGKLAGSGFLGSIAAGKAIPKMAVSYIGGKLAQNLAPKPIQSTGLQDSIPAQPANPAQPVSGQAPADTAVVDRNDPRINQAQRRARFRFRRINRRGPGKYSLGQPNLSKKTLLG